MRRVGLFLVVAVSLVAIRPGAAKADLLTDIAAFFGIVLSSSHHAPNHGYGSAPAPLLAAGIPAFMALGGGALLARRKRAAANTTTLSA